MAEHVVALQFALLRNRVVGEREGALTVVGSLLLGGHSPGQQLPRSQTWRTSAIQAVLV
ncbi:MAG: hypothetical protein ACR2IP_04560 [Solirubrobacteraceae bacterium]